MYFGMESGERVMLLLLEMLDLRIGDVRKFKICKKVIEFGFLANWALRSIRVVVVIVVLWV